MRTGEVLVVEDNAANQHLFHALLTAAGYGVRIAEDGQAALAALREDRFDVVLMDGHMPVMNGIDTVRRIRASRSAYANVPVIALTADALTRDRSAYLDAGMDDYLSKPVDLRLLLSKVDWWIGRQRS